MAKIVISDGKESIQIEKDIDSLINKKIGDVIDGSIFGLPGYELLITGGSDKDGFPMRKDVTGTVRKSLLLSDGAGIRAAGKGVRLKKTVKGNVISKDIAQLNTKVVKRGAKSVKELLGAEIKQEEKKEEKPAEGEEKAEEPKEEKEEKKKEEKEGAGEEKEEKPEGKAKPEEEKGEKKKEEKKAETKPAEEKGEEKSEEKKEAEKQSEPKEKSAEEKEE